MNQPIAVQQAFWNEWNASTREQRLSDISIDQRDVVVRWLTATGRSDLRIIEVGCGAGWLCPTLAQFGRVTGTDLSDEVLTRASQRMPDVEFVAGDFMALEFPEGTFDVVVTIEMLSHVADKDAFMAKITRLLKPGGLMMMATQNRPVLEKYNNIPPPKPGQLRQWVDRAELETLLNRHLTVREVQAVTPNSNKGIMRFIAGRTARHAIRKIAGKGPERMLAKAGFGWTLMALAQKSEAQQG